MPAVFVLIWSTGFIVARYGMPHAPPMKFLAVRYALSVAAFLLWAWLARAAWPRNGRQLAHLAITGIFMHAGYLGGVWAAVKAGMGAGLAALPVGLQPVLTAVWISTRGGQVAARQWAGLALGLAGLVLVVWQKLGLGEVGPLNLAFAFIALVSITAGTLYQKRYCATFDLRTGTIIQFAASIVVVLPFAIVFEHLNPMLETVQWTPRFVGALLWAIFALSIGAIFLLFALIRKSAATQVTSLLYLTPPTTAVMAWVMFGEAFSIVGMIGMLLAVIGVALVIRK
jgi:drug/metabolite transporter (DMT)-like permease